MKFDNDLDRCFVQLEKLLQGQQKVLILLHHNPDPDALASAMALRYLAQKIAHVKSTIAYSGWVGRAENRAMVRELKIPLKKLHQVNYTHYDRIAVLDTQPGAGNTAIPADLHCHLVIDHHPQRRGLNSQLTIIEPDIGATATLLTLLLEISCFPIPPDIATALTYAIRSETQDLGRDATSKDVKAHFFVYSRASMRKLARISRPRLSRSYFITLANVLQKTRVFRHLSCAHLGEILMPEVVAEMADLLMRQEHISWVLCTGRFGHTLYLSIRSTNTKAHAGKLIKKLVPDPNNAGGHDMFAGGKIELHSLSEIEIASVEAKLSQDFARLLGHAGVHWTPLIEETL